MYRQARRDGHVMSSRLALVPVNDLADWPDAAIDQVAITLLGGKTVRSRRIQHMDRDGGHLPTGIFIGIEKGSREFIESVCFAKLTHLHDVDGRVRVQV